MFNISEYLKKFSKLEKESKDTKDAVEKGFQEICGIAIDGFELKSGVLYIKGKPTVKSIIFMRKSALLEHFSRSLPQKIIDIR